MDFPLRLNRATGFSHRQGACLVFSYVKSRTARKKKNHPFFPLWRKREVHYVCQIGDFNFEPAESFEFSTS